MIIKTYLDKTVRMCEELIHTTTLTNSENIMPSERSQAQKAILLYDFIYMKHSGKQIHRDGK